MGLKKDHDLVMLVFCKSHETFSWKQLISFPMILIPMLNTSVKATVKIYIGKFSETAKKYKEKLKSIL